MSKALKMNSGSIDKATSSSKFLVGEHDTSVSTRRLSLDIPDGMDTAGVAIL
jgi:hypothetical protein